MNFSKSLVTVVLLLCITNVIYAQSTEFKTMRNLAFSESSKTQAVEINISKGTAQVNLDILCSVNEGNVTIEIYSPSGEKHGEFSVEGLAVDDSGSLYSSVKEGVSGQIMKRIINPEIGKWIIKFIPKKASGDVRIATIQYM